MVKLYTLLALMLTIQLCSAQSKNAIMMESAKFITGDDAAWSNPAFDDSSWKTIKTSRVWQSQGYNNYNGFGWYRIHVIIPSSLKTKALWQDSLRVFLAHVNDVDDSYLNGVKIGKIGAFPDDPGGYVSKWPAERSYNVSTRNPIIKWDADNIIAIRVYDGGGTGGIFMGTPYIDMVEKIDGIEINTSASFAFLPNKKTERKLQIKNKYKTTVTGTFHYEIVDQAAAKTLEEKTTDIVINPLSTTDVKIGFPHREGIAINYSFVEKGSGSSKKYTEIAPYLLTPAESTKPEINGAEVLGLHKGSPFIYKIPVSGKRPMIYAATNLPAGLSVDVKTGVIKGKVDQDGDYTVILIASNSFGKSQKRFTIKIGNKLALTPPMGWNSWNCWGLSVSDEKVRSSANAMLQKGLANYGWNSINIDDGWQADKRTESGEIVAASKFPDMKKLSDYLHNSGLKFGIYSSPGPKTCGGYLGSYQHEAQDAVTYNQWGVDYLKYDLCSYENIIGRSDTTLAAQQKPYIVMQRELQKQPRSITYSLCQYGIKNVWQWGPMVDGNLWRTTGDIIDTWESLSNIGFRQERFSDYAHPGGWNDPDMLIVGMVGWGENLHPTRLTPYEQYTHISLWSMLSAPLLIGCDMSRLDEFTLNLLKNREVLAIDQDELGKQAKRVINEGNIQVWVKQLADGGKAVAVFNLNPAYKAYKLSLKSVGIESAKIVRDVWTQQNMPAAGDDVSFNVPPHGVRLIKVK